jgi:pimeloyl-ACP methyl ester carboxylesterase
MLPSSSAVKIIGVISILGFIFSCGGPRLPPGSEKRPDIAEADSPKAVQIEEEKESRLPLTGNWFMDTRAAFVLDGVWYGMGNVNEIVDTAERIRHTSELSAYREWMKTADWALSLAEQSLSGGHGISAGAEYLRAAQYYLAAELFLHTNPGDPRILEAYKKAGDLFIRGLTLSRQPVELVAIPYEGTTLRGYFFRARSVKGRAPTVIAHQGYDAPVESTKYLADAAVIRGYNCLVFEGPGQGLTIREKGIPFRPDWEKVISPVVDYAVSRPDVDPAGLILMGISFGGGLAARAAAYEPRIKILVLNPGYVSLSRMFEDVLPEKLVNLYEEDPEGFNDKALEELAAFDVGARWGLHHGMWVFGADTPADFFARLKEYEYSADIGRIQAKTVVMDGSAEQYGAGQAKELYELLTCAKHYMLFTADEHAGDHCQIGAPALAMERLFNWLDENI